MSQKETSLHASFFYETLQAVIFYLLHAGAFSLTGIAGYCGGVADCDYVCSCILNTECFVYLYYVPR